MTSEVFKASLSTNQKHLLELMQRINFGRIENLAVNNGEPIFKPPPSVIYKKKIGGDNNPRSETDLQDFRLRKEVVEVFDILKHHNDGIVRKIEVQDGLPRFIEVEEKFGAET